MSAHTSVGLEQHSIALCEQVTSIIDDDLIENLGQVDKYTLNQITEAVKVQIGAYEKYNI